MIFEQGFQRPSDPVIPILNMAREVVAYGSRGGIGLGHDITVNVARKPPQQGWVKLNADGAFNHLDLIAGCGGLLRDSNGQWIAGFSRKIGHCDALQAEMWGMLEGMQIAWQKGIRKLNVESDSKVLVDLVNNRSRECPTMHTLVRRIRREILKDWEVHVTHVYREGNRCADWLANHSLGNDLFGVQIAITPPTGLHQLMAEDNSGVYLPRTISSSSSSS